MTELADQYPECKRLADCSDDSQKIGEFIDWCNAQGYHLCEYLSVTPNSRTKQLSPLSVTMEQLLAKYFNIDLKVVETERRKLLDELRK